MKWLLRSYMVANHIETKKELSEECGIPEKRLRNRINNPSTLNSSELRMLDSVLHFSDEDLARIVRGQV